MLSGPMMHAGLNPSNIATGAEGGGALTLILVASTTGQPSTGPLLNTAVSSDTVVVGVSPHFRPAPHVGWEGRMMGEDDGGGGGGRGACACCGAKSERGGGGALTVEHELAAIPRFDHVVCAQPFVYNRQHVPCLVCPYQVGAYSSTYTKVGCKVVRSG
jgi:hypothetical protein